MRETMTRVERSDITMGRFGSIFQKLYLTIENTNEELVLSPTVSPIPIEEKLKALHVDVHRRIMIQGDINTQYFKVYTVPISPKNECPFCKQPLRTLGKMLVCENNSCIGRISARLMHLCSKDGLDIPFILEKKFNDWVTLLRKPEFAAFNICNIFNRDDLYTICNAFEMDDFNTRAYILPKMDRVKEMLSDPVFYSSAATPLPMDKYMQYVRILDSFSIPGISVKTLTRVVYSAFDPTLRSEFKQGTEPAFNFIVTLMTEPAVMFAARLPGDDITTLCGMADVYKNSLKYILSLCNMH